MKLQKIIFLLCLILASNISLAQERRGNTVYMPIENYNAFRGQLLLCDTLKQDCDSTILDLTLSNELKAQRIVILEQKSVLKDSIIVQKNITISSLIAVTDKKKPLITKGSLIGVIIGIVFTMLTIR